MSATIPRCDRKNCPHCDRAAADRERMRAELRDRISIAATDAARMEDALRYIAHENPDLCNEALTDAGVSNVRD